MRHQLKRLIQSYCLLIFLGNVLPAFADTANDAETVLNWAENTFPSFFPSHKSTQNIVPWLFRHYPETDVYAGVNTEDNNIYVLGGSWGNEAPTRIDTLSNLVAYIANTGGNASIPACDTTNAPVGVAFTQNDNIVNITSNGQCILAPADSNLCQAPPQSVPTGISVLSTSSVTSSELKGVSIDTPGTPSQFQSIVDSVSTVKHCTINAPAEANKLIINTNVCYDLTSEFQAVPDTPGIAINTPVTFSFAGTITNKSVADCFATEALTITDAHTGEVWIIDTAQATKNLAKNSGCLNCHNVDSKLVGPAFSDVAAKYAGQADAGTILAGRIRNGSVGVWGAIPMPPNNGSILRISDADFRALAEWILFLK